MQENLFAYALKEIRKLVKAVNFPIDSHRSELETLLSRFPKQYTASASDLIDHVETLMAKDEKLSYFKELQAYVWRTGYKTGELVSPLFPDVPRALKRWQSQADVYIYSSCVIESQKLIFSQTNYGDMAPYITGFFDRTNAGPKVDKDSYDKIAHAVSNRKPHLFSDNPREINAADEAGWSTTWIIRPGNRPQPGYRPPKAKATSLLTCGDESD